MNSGIIPTYDWQPLTNVNYQWDGNVTQWVYPNYYQQWYPVYPAPIVITVAPDPRVAELEDRVKKLEKKLRKLDGKAQTATL